MVGGPVNPCPTYAQGPNCGKFRCLTDRASMTQNPNGYGRVPGSYTARYVATPPQCDGTASDPVWATTAFCRYAGQDARPAGIGGSGFGG